MKRTLFPALLVAVSLGLAGCDVEQGGTSGAVSPGTTTPAGADPTGGIDVDIDTGDSPVENRIERRQERRENIREAIDDVDVNVGNGGVDVKVD